MQNKKTQKQIVKDRLNEVGFVDNFWAIQNYILRLGAIIHDLRDEGWQFETRFGVTHQTKKNFYYYRKRYQPPRTEPFPEAYPQKKVEAREPVNNQQTLI